MIARNSSTPSRRCDDILKFCRLAQSPQATAACQQLTSLLVQRSARLSRLTVQERCTAQLLLEAQAQLRAQRVRSSAGQLAKSVPSDNWRRQLQPSARLQQSVLAKPAKAWPLAAGPHSVAPVEGASGCQDGPASRLQPGRRPTGQAVESESPRPGHLDTASPRIADQDLFAFFGCEPIHVSSSNVDSGR